MNTDLDLGIEWVLAVTGPAAIQAKDNIVYAIQENKPLDSETSGMDLVAGDTTMIGVDDKFWCKAAKWSATITILKK